MEGIHCPEGYAFISEPISVSKFLEDAKSAYDCIGAANFAAPTPDKILQSHGGSNVPERKRWRLVRSATTRARLGLSDEAQKKLYLSVRKRCRPSLLRDGTELSDELFVDGLIPRQHRLESLRLLDAESDKRRDKPGYSQAVALRLRTRKVNYRIVDDGREQAAQRWATASVQPGTAAQFYPSDVLMTVHMCRPYNRALTHAEIRLGRVIKEETSFEVLGSTRLVQLADAVACLSDYAVNQDQSAHSMYLDQHHAVFAKTRFKSRFLFIGNTFYCDLSDPEAIDLSEEFRSWAARRGNSFGKFNVADMCTSCVRDLRDMRLGQPYVYLHQAFCEHLIVFSQLRLLGPDDVADPSSYPRQTTFTARRQAACVGCTLTTARWTVHGNERLPMDPAFFCDTCYRKFNFDADGNKLADFTAVPYIDKTALK